MIKMFKKPMNIFLHFLNKDTQEIFGLSSESNPYIRSLLRKGLNAAVLLCDTETFCFLPLGFWFESNHTRELLIESSELIKNGYICFSIREGTIPEFIEKKREQYSLLQRTKGLRTLYQSFYDANVLKQLLDLNPILIDRTAKIGSLCSNLWKFAHDELILNNTGNLITIYSKIDNISDREKISKKIADAAADPESPFVWTKVLDLITRLSIKDKLLPKELRIYFEKNYYSVYLNEYRATNLYNFYLIDKCIDFHIERRATAAADYRWLETFLTLLELQNALDAPDWKIADIKRSPYWSLLLEKYFGICNDEDLINGNCVFSFACNKILSDSQTLTAASKIREIINMDKKKTYFEIEKSFEDEKKVADPDSTVDVLIMVATKDEEKAIINNEDKWDSKVSSGGYKYFTRTEGLRFALARSVDMGMESSATATQYYISELKPRFLAMAGFSAGKKGKVNLGDIVVPYKVYQYDNGEQLSENDTLPEINMHRIDYLWQQKAERFGDDWRNTVTVPRPPTYERQRYLLLKMLIDQGFTADIRILHNNNKLPDINLIIKDYIKKGWLRLNREKIEATDTGREKINRIYYLDYNGEFDEPVLKTKIGVLATGNKVQKWSKIFRWLEEKHDRKTCVLDMEGYAIADVARFNHIPCLIAKGIGDFASDNKAFDNRYIAYSVFSAYRFIIAFFNDLDGKELLSC